jgi:hypothetical protein
MDDDAPAIPSGYSFAARVTVGFDGGYHPLKGDLWKCRSCASLIVPADKDVHERFHALLDSLLGASDGPVPG